MGNDGSWGWERLISILEEPVRVFCILLMIQSSWLVDGLLSTTDPGK